MNAVALAPERAWQVALDQLEREMPKATFEQWVLGAKFVSFEGQLCVISVTSAYQREWLESRLTSTLKRLLTGILNQTVEVQFTLIGADGEGSPETGEYPDPVASEPRMPGQPETLTLQAEYQTIYDEIVRPDQVIVFPGYFLRFIPFLGAELAWMYIGFRQAAYLAGAIKEPGRKFPAPAKQVAAYAGMGLRTFRRWCAKPETWKKLSWFVEAVDDKPFWSRQQDGHPHQSATRYKIKLSLPLTPSDRGSLFTWLRQQISAGLSLLNALQKSLDTPIEELIPWPAEDSLPELVNDQLATVQEVVVEICMSLNQPVSPEIQKLADALALRLMPPKDLVVLTHYFVEQWLPRLGSGPGWFVVLLRDRGYINSRTGEMRDIVYLESGYAELAKLLGLRRVKTIWEWIRDDPTPSFVREIEKGEGDWETASRRFQVCLGEPMTPEDCVHAERSMEQFAIGASGTHREISKRLLVGAFGNGAQGTPETGENPCDSVSNTTDDPNRFQATDERKNAPYSPLEAEIDPKNGGCSHPIGASDTHKSEIPGDSVGAFGRMQNRVSDLPVGAIDTHRIGADGTRSGAFVPTVGASDIHRVGAIDTHSGAIGTSHWREWHSLNTLTLGFKHSANTLTTTAGNGADETEFDPEVQGVVGKEWNLDELLICNHVSPKISEWMKGKISKPENFVSWLLYAASPAGNSLREPVGHAITRLAAHPDHGAGGVFDELASLPPTELTALICAALNGPCPPHPVWGRVMKDATRNRLRALAQQLGGTVPEAQYW